jgi:sirohydrochlorin cobaltochelatase
MPARATEAAAMLRPAWPPGCGLLVVGHGTADAVGAAETRATAGLAAALLPGVPVGIGFLEIASPSIGTAVTRLAGRGCRTIVAAPLLLFAAGHARRDVPEALVAAAAQAGVGVLQSAPFGCHERIVELSARRRREAVERLAPVDAADTVLVMIGRGSSAPDAVPQLREFAQLSVAAGGTPPAGVELAFVAAARPTLDEALAAAADRAAVSRRVVVQPHLLFHGHVQEQVTAAVDRWRAARPEIEWVQVERLGADGAVAAALVDRAGEAARLETRQGSSGEAEKHAPDASRQASGKSPQ